MAKLYDGQKLDFPIEIHGDYKSYVIWIVGLTFFISAMLYHAIIVTPPPISFDLATYKIHIILILVSIFAIVGFLLAFKNCQPILVFTQQGVIYKKPTMQKNEIPDITWEAIEKITVDYGKYCKNGSVNFFLKKPMLSGEPKTIHFYNGTRLYGALIKMREIEDILRQVFVEKKIPVFHIQKVKFLDEYTKSPVLKRP